MPKHKGKRETSKLIGDFLIGRVNLVDYANLRTRKGSANNIMSNFLLSQSNLLSETDRARAWELTKGSAIKQGQKRMGKVIDKALKG